MWCNIQFCFLLYCSHRRFKLCLIGIVMGFSAEHSIYQSAQGMKRIIRSVHGTVLLQVDIKIKWNLKPENAWKKRHDKPKRRQKMLLNVRHYIILGTHFALFYYHLLNKSIFEIIYLIVHKNVFGHSIF